MMHSAWRLLIPLILLSCATAQTSTGSAGEQANQFAATLSPPVPLTELAQRREAALMQFHDGILLLHSGSGLKLRRQRRMSHLC